MKRKQRRRRISMRTARSVTVSRMWQESEERGGYPVPAIACAANGLSRSASAKARAMATRRDDAETIGDRIRRYRKAKGLTQTELGKRVGLSQRLMTYYESQGGSPSPDLLTRFAKELGVSVNVLMGVAPEPRAASRPDPDSVRLWRRFRRLEELPENDRKTVLKMIDALAERRQSKRGR